MWLLLLFIIFSSRSPVLMWMIFASSACIISLNSHGPWISRFIVDTAPVVPSAPWRVMVVCRWRFREIIITISQKTILMVILSLWFQNLQSDTNHNSSLSNARNFNNSTACNTSLNTMLKRTHNREVVPTPCPPAPQPIQKNWVKCGSVIYSDITMNFSLPSINHSNWNLYIL